MPEKENNQYVRVGTRKEESLVTVTVKTASDCADVTLCTIHTTYK